MATILRTRRDAPATAPRAPSRHAGRAATILLVVVAAALAVLVSFVGRTRDVRIEAPRLSGSLWRAGTAEQPLLLYISAEYRRRTLRRSGRLGSYFSRPYTRYRLEVRRIPGGELLHAVQLADRREVSDTRAPEVLGVVGERVWLWRDSLEGWALPSLTLDVTPGSLALVGNAARDVLPTEPRGFAIASTLRTLVARGRDARFYRIDATPPTLAPLDPAELPPTNNSMKVEDRFDYLIPPERSRVMTHPNSAMQKHFVTSTGLWYALLSDTERKNQSSWLYAEDAPNGEVARSLYRTTYRLDGRQLPEIDLRGLQPVGNERLIQAGFMVRSTRRVWDVADPSSSLVMARARLGEQEPWEVLRLTREGAVLWRTSTGLPTPYLLLDLGTHLALFGDEPRDRSGDREGGRPRYRPDDPRQMVVWIDERSGARRTLSLATGEVR